MFLVSIKYFSTSTNCNYFSSNTATDYYFFCRITSTSSTVSSQPSIDSTHCSVKDTTPNSHIINTPRQLHTYTAATTATPQQSTPLLNRRQITRTARPLSNARPTYIYIRLLLWIHFQFSSSSCYVIALC